MRGYRQLLRRGAAPPKNGPSNGKTRPALLASRSSSLTNCDKLISPRGAGNVGVIQMAHDIARWSLISVIVLLVGPTVLAQTAPTTTQPVPWNQAARFRMDCGQDVHRFCHGVQPGEGRLIQCLSSHRSELSPACTSRLTAARPTLGVVPPSPNTQR